MATLYFNSTLGGADGLWSTVGNWWTDDPQTTPAGATPTSSDEAIIVGGETIDEIPATMTCSSNLGTITANNGTVTDNSGTIITNNGTVTTNSLNITTNGGDGDIGTNNGTVTENNGQIDLNTSVGTVTTNKGNITDNSGTVVTNDTTGVIEEHKYILTDNYGEVTATVQSVGTNITNNQDGGVIGLLANQTTLITNLLGGEVTDCQGAITNNYGLVVENNFGPGGGLGQGGEITTNYDGGEVTTNNNVITTNYGLVTTIGDTGIVRINEVTGEVTDNGGSVGDWSDKSGYNYGLIETNNSYVTTNGGSIFSGYTTGTITLNKGVVNVNESYGTVVTNNGIVSDKIFAQGSTTWGAMVLSNGGTITNNFGLIGGSWSSGQSIADQGGNPNNGNYGTVTKHHGVIVNNVGGFVHLWGSLSFGGGGNTGNTTNNTNWSGAIMFFNYGPFGHGMIWLHNLPANTWNNAFGITYSIGNPTGDPNAFVMIDPSAFTDPTAAEVAKDVTYAFEGVTKIGTKRTGGGVNGSGILGMI